jgi:hypothetical protein
MCSGNLVGDFIALLSERKQAEAHRAESNHDQKELGEEAHSG